MSSLSVYHVSSPDIPNKVLTHLEDIASTLAEQGVRFDRWQAAAKIQPGATQEEVISAYKEQIDQLMSVATSPSMSSASTAIIRKKPNCAPSSLKNTAMLKTKYDFSSPGVGCLPCTSTITSTQYSARRTI
jgi:hypothetical protein